MDLKIAYFKDVGGGRWEAWLEELKTAGYRHRTYWLDYCSGFQNVLENGSFALLEGSRPVVACPLFLSEIDGRRELSVNGAPLGAPAAADGLRPSARRRVLDAAFEAIDAYAAEKGAGRIVLVSDPLAGNAGSAARPENLFEMMRYRLLYRVENTLVIDLSLPEETLVSNMGRYQRRHVSRGRKQGIAAKAFNGNENAGALASNFEQFQKAHLASAGRLTRPLATWDLMLKAAGEGHATLFVAFLGDEPMSYLFCGESGPMAFGWSQANIERYEDEYSPRHVLEWEAILRYQKRGFGCYEVGERYFGPQPLYIPTEKEITIGDFKERYGGMMLPKVFWRGYWDLDLMKAELSRHYSAFMSLDNRVRVPGREAYVEQG